MAGKCSVVSVIVTLFVLTIFDNPIIVDAGQGVPLVGLFTFGDSSYDVGNKVFLTTKANPPQTMWPYGKSRDNPNGKFSDGHIVPDFIGDFMDIPNGIPPALKSGVNLTRGASFAVADASILGTPEESMTLNLQVKKFKDMISSWTKLYIEKSLFMIYIGTEDYLNFTKNNPKADTSSQQAFVVSVINRLKSDIGELKTLGATKFAVTLLAPLGCLPIVRQEYETGMDACHEQLNDLAKLHNEKIGPMLNDFAKNLKDFSSLSSITTLPLSVGLRQAGVLTTVSFFVTNSSCCGVGTHQAYGCGFPNVHSKLCEYQRSYFFFDGRHNSEKGQEELAHLIYGGNPTVVQPMNLRELITFPIGENMREFWEPNKLSTRRSRRPSLRHTYLDLAAYY